MNLQDRYMRMIYLPDRRVILASDVKGRIHLLDLELNLLRSSMTTSYRNPINGLATDGRHVFTKDRYGVIGKWDLDTLRPIRLYDPAGPRDEADLLEDEEPSPAANRGLSVLNGRVYCNNGYSQFVVLDAETFDLLEVRPQLTAHSFVDCVCVDSPKIQALSEINGLVHIGNLETGDLSTVVAADSGGVHWVRYDRLHDRFIATQDAGLGEDRYAHNGLATFEPDGSNLKTYPFTCDDVEFLQFNANGTKVYAGGFDGYVYVYDNTDRDELRLQTRIGPFNYQLINLVHVSDDQLYVLMQTGEIVCVNAKGDIQHRADFAHQCVWSLEAHPEDDGLVYASTDDSVQLLRYGAGAYGTVKLDVIAKHPHNFGPLLRVKPLADGSYVAMGRRLAVFRADTEGRLLWYKRTDGNPRSLAVDPERGRLMVGTDEGLAVEYDLQDGRELERFSFDGKTCYTVGYAPDGRRVMGLKAGQIYVYAAEGKELLHDKIKLTFYPKRFFVQDGKCFLTGVPGVLELDLDNGEVKKTFKEFMVNTKENGFLLDEHMHVLSYGYQIGSYEYESGELIYLIEGLQDFAKAITGRIDEEGRALLLVGGRSGYINAYHVKDGVPHKVMEAYL